MIFLPLQKPGGFGTAGQEAGVHTGRAEDFTDKFAGERIVIDNKNP
jgi:hypothetical protein